MGVEEYNAKHNTMTTDDVFILSLFTTLRCFSARIGTDLERLVLRFIALFRYFALEISDFFTISLLKNIIYQADVANNS